MRDHELELIAALVEGRLDDETEARALISSSPEARGEYVTQKLAYDALRSVGTARLTETEKAALHRDVWTELRTETPAKRKTPWYYRWVPVAAGLFVIVGLAAVLSGGSPDAGTTFEETAGELSSNGEVGASPTTTAADATAFDSAQDGGGDESAQTDTTEAASEATTTAAASEPEEAAALYVDEAEQVRNSAFTARLQDYEEADDGDVAACLEQADLLNYEPVATLTSPDPEVSDLEETLIIAAPADAELAEATLAFIDLDTCELVYVDQP